MMSSLHKLEVWAVKDGSSEGLTAFVCLIDNVTWLTAA